MKKKQKNKKKRILSTQVGRKNFWNLQKPQSAMTFNKKKE